MTLRKLAALTGYSLSTVSKAFSGSKEISEPTRQIIFAEAKKQGCFEKYCKEKYDQRIIAVVCPETASAHYTEILSVLNRLVSDKGATMAISITEFSTETEQRLLSFYASGRADGILVIGGNCDIPTRTSVPIVCLGGTVSDNHDAVLIDMESGMREAIGTLKSKGHRQLAFIGEELTVSKEKLFQRIVKEYRLPEPTVIRTEQRFEAGGYRAAAALLQQQPIPSAIVAAYDYMAFGAINAIREAGFRVPEDISVIGSDDIRTAAYERIGLTTITLNTLDACRLAVDRLFQKIDHPTYQTVQTTVIKSQLVPRKTVAEYNSGISK